MANKIWQTKTWQRITKTCQASILVTKIRQTNLWETKTWQKITMSWQTNTWQTKTCQNDKS